MDGGGFSYTGINAVNGGTTNSDQLGIGKVRMTRMDTTRARLDEAFKNKRTVTAGISPGFGQANLPQRHEYSVVGWDRATRRHDDDAGGVPQELLHHLVPDEVKT